MASEKIQKLKIEDLPVKLVLNKPEDIRDFDGLKFDVSFQKTTKYDLIFAFIFVLDEFPSLVDKVITEDLLNPGGYLYFAYPKKGNKQYEKYIGRDDFFPSVRMDDDGFVNESPIKFNKMLSFSEVFTCIGLKYETKVKKRTQPSQCVADYIDRIPELIKNLAQKPEILALFNGLTPGYQRGWARFVFGVKNEETQVKRLAEMEKILKEGFKSVDLYRLNKK